MIRSIKSKDAQAIAAIYNHYIDHTVVTFETETIQASDMLRRMMDISTILPFIVYERDDEILGYAYANKWRQRAAYSKSVESSIYLKHGHEGQGIGTAIYKQLIDQLLDMDIHAIIGGIALPNIGSIALHQKLGFKKVAHFQEVGYKFNQWIDVAYWELIR